MKKIISYIITICLIAIVILMLMRNKKEINAQIAFAEQKVEAYPVKVARVKSGTIDLQLAKSGILSASDELMLMAETQGRILKIYKKEGDWVKKGDAIAQVNAELMRAELMVTEANYKKAQKDLERAQTLNDGGAITQQQLEGLQLNEKAANAKYIASSKRVADALIKAPISGYINKLFLKEGGMIGPGVLACELVNIRSLKMSVKVDEKEVIMISKGFQTEVVVESLNGKILQGLVISVGAKADYALQYAVEILISENPEERLKAGMLAKAIFRFKDDAEGPIIPRNAIVGSIKDPKVYIVDKDRAQLTSISIEQLNGEEVKCLEGIEIGETIVIAGQSNLQDQMKVTVIE
jgi:RND family efflux transporter MFP subunit